MEEKKTMLVVFFLESSSHKTRLNLLQKEDTTIIYSYYSGWQYSGTGESFSNMQMKEPLPVSVRPFKNVHALIKEVERVLATGYYKPTRIEVVNDLQPVKPLKRSKA